MKLPHIYYAPLLYKVQMKGINVGTRGTSMIRNCTIQFTLSMIAKYLLFQFPHFAVRNTIL